MPTNWTAALADYERLTMAAEVIPTDEAHDDGYGAAISTQDKTVHTLLQVPAPDLKAVATKLQIMHREGYQDQLSHVLADIERLADMPPIAMAPWGYRTEKGFILPPRFLGISDAMATAIADYRTAYFGHGMDAEVAGGLVNEAALKLVKTPALSLHDLAAKILMGLLDEAPSHQGEHLMIALDYTLSDRSSEMLLACAVHAVELAARLGSQAEDPRIVEAFETYCDNFARLKALGNNANEDAFYERLDHADMVLKTTPALTAAGVAMKLKRIFVAYVGEQWSDQAVFDQRPDDFDQHVEMSDLYQEMLWRAIEDLERITEKEVRA